MTSVNKPMTLIGKQLTTPPHKQKAYRTKAYVSEVDETLFGTPSRFTQQVDTKRLSNEKEWDPPWVTSPTKKGAPLLWTPFSTQDFEGSIAPTSDGTPQRTRSKPSTPRSARLSNKYRMKSQTPSYVDETLFGPRPIEPSFKAPWEDNETAGGIKHLIWSPTANHVDSPRSDISFDDRPGSRLGEYHDPYIPPTPRDGTSNNSLTTPVIKHRSGSNIKTPSCNFASHTNDDTDRVKLKLNFDEQNQLEKDQLIERALRLARHAQEAAIKTKSPHSRQVWTRPSSARSSPRLPTSGKSPRLSDFVDNLSATGVRVPLSARGSDTGSCPSSARVRSRSAQRPHSARSSSDRPSWRP